VPNPRLRQVALAARHLAPVADELSKQLGLRPPFHDPDVGVFGLENSVFAVGDTFVEVVAPTRDGTTAGRYLDRRGGDCGYMAIFQVDDVAEARRRIDDLGIRVVWRADLPDMAGTHLHPKDVPGALVSVDWADPPESWRWAGPEWTGGAAGERVLDGIVGLTVRTPDPDGLAGRWAEVLGVDADGPVVRLDGGAQTLSFEQGGAERDEGIVGIDVAGGDEARTTTIGGVAFRLRPAQATG
jgi:hypothetical protein